STSSWDGLRTRRASRAGGPDSGSASLGTSVRAPGSPRKKLNCDHRVGPSGPFLPRRTAMRLLISSLLLLAMAQGAAAQPSRPPGGRDGGRPGGPGRDGGPARGDEGRGSAPSADEFIGRLMSLDANQDGKLTREEVADVRLHPLLTRADANQDGAV